MELDILIYSSGSSIFIQSESMSIGKVLVFDLNGRLVLSKGESGQNTSLNLTKYASGIYLVQVQKKDHLITRKVWLD